MSPTDHRPDAAPQKRLGPIASGAAMKRLHPVSLWHDAWAALSVYLPVLVMAVMALGSWWLVRSAPEIGHAEAPHAPRHEPDYFMEEFSVRRFMPDGLLHDEVQGKVLNHFPDTDTLEITAPDLLSFDALNRRVIATALRAKSNADASQVELFEQAKVTRFSAPGRHEPLMRFTGEYLHVFAKDNRVESDVPVVLTRGNSRFTGGSLRYSDKTGVAELGQPVTGFLPLDGTRR